MDMARITHQLECQHFSYCVSTIEECSFCGKLLNSTKTHYRDEQTENLVEIINMNYRTINKIHDEAVELYKSYEKLLQYSNDDLVDN